MNTERIIGADIMMAFDECPPGQSDFMYAKKSLEMTQRWLDRCIKRFDETEPLYGYQQSLFPIVQAVLSQSCAAKQPSTLPTREPTEMPSAVLP